MIVDWTSINSKEKLNVYLKSKTQLDKAIAKAKQIRPRVEFDVFGRYRVSGTRGGYYTVICTRSDNN
jgi:hypothetical protein